MIVLRSILTYFALGIYVLIAGPLCLLIAFVTRSPGPLYRAAQIGVHIGLALSGVRTRVEGLEHLQRHRAAVYAVNHASNVEPPIIFNILSELFPKLRVLYKAELRKLPVLVRAFDLAGFVPVERGNPEQNLPAVEGAAQALREGNSFLIFPEGTRSPTGELLPFKKGGFIMALQAGAPVVPVAIAGAREAMRKGSPWIRPVTVHVRFGLPIETTGLTVDDRDQLISRVRGEVARLLQG